MPYRDADDARRVHLRRVDSLTIATPCRERWNRMQGDERVRHCSRCSKDVHDLSAMSLEEIAALVERLQGKLCARFYRRPDGRLVTDDCPSTDTARRASRIAAGAVAALGVATAAALIATAPKPVHPPTEEEQLVGLIADEDEYIPVTALPADDGVTLEEVVGEVAILRNTAIDELVDAGATQATFAHAPLFESVCSRLNPAGSFEDSEIESFDMVQLPLPGSCGWGRCSNPERCD